MSERGIGLIENMVYIQSPHCGYCGGIEGIDGSNSKKINQSWSLDHLKKEYRCPASSFGFHAAFLSLHAYQELIDRGWRRSGSYVYRNDMLRSCCRHYTIRTSLNDLLNGYYKKEHRHSLNRFYKHMCPGLDSSSKVNLSLLAKFQKYEVDNDCQFISELTTAEFTDEKFQLWKKYQTIVHKDDVEELTESSFQNFLCTDPFIDEVCAQVNWDQVNVEWKQRKGGINLQKLAGAIHEAYYHVDKTGVKKLIALAVLDILDHGVSSIYFIYDPDYSYLGLGTVSALREICLTEILGRKWYYMGYYVPDCNKMKYKSKFGGEILDLGHYSPDGDIDDQWWKLRDVASVLSDGQFHTFEQIDGKVIDVTDKLYGSNGTRWCLPVNDKWGENDQRALLDLLCPTQDYERKFPKQIVEISDVDRKGPFIVPGCHLFPKEKINYLIYHFKAANSIRVYDYKKRKEVDFMNDDLAKKTFMIYRTIGPNISILLII